MIRDALEFLASLVQAAQAPTEIGQNDPRKKLYLVGTQTVEVAIPTPPRYHQVHTIGEIIRLAARFADEDGCKPVVWYDEKVVRLIIDDDASRAEQAYFLPEKSEVFRTLEALEESGDWLDQKAFVRLLRINLAGTLEPVHLLEKVRKVNFENGVTVRGNVTRSSESMGREITSKVTTAEGEIPEFVTLSAPVYSSWGLTKHHGIDCSVEVDSARGAFRLIPMPDELKLVKQRAVMDMGEMLLEGLPESVPCYHGSK